MSSEFVRKSDIFNVKSKLILVFVWNTNALVYNCVAFNKRVVIFKDV